MLGRKERPIPAFKNGDKLVFRWVHLPGETLTGVYKNGLVDVKSHKWREQSFSLTIAAIDIVHQYRPGKAICDD